MKDQNFKNHANLVTGFHGVLFVALVALLAGSVYHLFSTTSENLYLASLMVLTAIILIVMAWYIRTFPLKAQDRAIRAEENMRHYAMTEKLLPSDLRMSQIIALRFASDDEFLPLMEKALKEKLSAKEIKSSIKSWKGDYYRV
ncbi:hypothetical protein LCGC14_0119280 [marine sediment metagenome]|uniref:Uncharacterized protein n=1 Tax=marine sediment metagenome TaxID=412755 RepID=A0A0F9VBF3_9ZZZZ|nr:DUF6526 family protein [Maribacter sp.]HDZ07431.1 hypothetical protein [Maribacter sp.]HEA79876.1 hypothetical protein [Maribacter sp.]